MVHGSYCENSSFIKKQPERNFATAAYTSWAKEEQG